MTAKFCVRFVEGDKRRYMVKDKNPEKQHQDQDLGHLNQRRKGRYSCLECKNRHLRCEGTFPVCLRCQQRGVTCRSTFRSAQWQVEMPWLTAGTSLSKLSSDVNHRLIQYWLEKASQIMTIDLDANPFSFELIRYLETSKSLVHGVQSLSVAHENFFGSSSLVKCLQERGQAMSLLQKELSSAKQPLQGSLLTVLLLGLSSAWVHHQTGDNFGREHLLGARAILDTMLADPVAVQEPFMRLAVATYMTWDQATAFLPHSRDQIPLHSDELLEFVQSMRSEFNGVIGYTIEVLYILGELGRYCRLILDGGPRDCEVESSFQDRLLTWAPTGLDHNADLVNDSFRKHGLIMLYRTISSAGILTPLDFTDDGCYRHENAIKQYTEDILDNIDSIPTDSRYHCFLGQPLLSAGSELSESAPHRREMVRRQFRRLFSATRIPSNLQAVQHLDELWELRDSGTVVFWMSHLLQKGRIFLVC